MNKFFPCPVCKGSGDFGDGDFVDVGDGTFYAPMQVSAHTPCSYCDEKGVIEIDGLIHRRNKIEKLVGKCFMTLGDDDAFYPDGIDVCIREKILEIRELLDSSGMSAEEYTKYEEQRDAKRV